MDRQTFEQNLAKLPKQRQDVIISRLTALLFGRLRFVSAKPRRKFRKLRR